MAQNLNELFDVVDEKDRVIGQATRREVHARGWHHRAVHVLVVNAAGQVFLQQRSLTKDLFPGAWDSSAAGHVGAGEDYDGTALRELEEELGCRPRFAPQRIFRVEACPETGAEFVWVYGVEAEGPFVFQPDEVAGGSWFSPDQIDRWIEGKPGDLASAFPLVWKGARSTILARNSG